MILAAFPTLARTLTRPDAHTPVQVPHPRRCAHSERVRGCVLGHSAAGLPSPAPPGFAADTPRS